MSEKIRLFNAQSSDASSTQTSWPGGFGLFDAWGIFGGGTVKLQYSPDGGTTWIDDVNAAFTSNGNVVFNLPRNAVIRANLSGSTSPTINASVSVIKGRIAR